MLAGRGATIPTRAVRATVVFDAGAWGSYGLMPLDVAPSPHAAFADEVRDAVERNLDYMIAQQADDGSWSPLSTNGP